MAQDWLRLFVLVISAFLKLNEGARILAVFPTPSISHQKAFRPITKELARRGHEVIVITPDPAYDKEKAPANLTEIDVHDISYKILQGEYKTEHAGKEQNVYKLMKVGLDVLHEIFSMQLDTPEFKRLIEEKVKFDLLLVEACVRPAMVLSHVFKVPMISMSSFGSAFYYRIVGAPIHEFLYPSSLRKRIYNLSLWEKFREIVKMYEIKFLLYNLEFDEHELMKKHFGEDTPSIHELRNNVDMMFLNINPIWEGIRPVPPNVVYTGGLHEYSELEIPKDLKSFIDSSNGTIYVSFGTNVNTSVIPEEVVQIMVKVFSRLPYRVLWKWDQDKLPGKPENIKISKHFPQANLLRHPKVKLFITQGGLQSTDEAISFGVPLIGIPIFFDQWYNVEKYVHFGIGEKLELEEISEETLRVLIKQVIGNESYRHNIKRLHTLMHDQPESPLERAIWWTEYVIRHSGARHLRTPTANAIWLEYVELEFFLVVLFLFVLLVFILGILIYVVKSRFFSKRELNKLKKT